MLFVALLGWVLTPVPRADTSAADGLQQSEVNGGTTDDAATSTEGVTGPGTASPPASPPGGDAAAPVTTAPSTPQGAASPVAGSGSPSSPTGSTKSCPGGSGAGVSASRVKLAILLVNIAGPSGNGAFGIPPPAEQQSYYQAALDEVNAGGGVACRELVAQYFKVNPADQNNLQQTCRDVADGGFFAVLDSGVYAQYPLQKCYADRKIPYFSSYMIAGRLQQAGYPYLFSFNLLDTVYRDAVFALKSRGYFTAATGFAKLGFIYHDCDGALVDRFKGWLQQSGVSSSQLVTYSVGCPTALSSPSDLQQAILKFKGEGVTHVTTLGFIGDFANFSKIAEQQGFRPKYGLADDAIVALSYGSQPPDANNIDGAVAITGSRAGENTTPGSTPTAGTARCNAAFAKKGIGPTYSLGTAAGNACSNVWMFAAAADHASAMKGDALAAGLQAARSVELSYPAGPNDFTAAGTTTGGQFWRPLQFHKSCRCWRIIDGNFQRTFP